jgi:hypothetical protein
VEQVVVEEEQVLHQVHLLLLEQLILEVAVEVELMV